VRRADRQSSALASIGVLLVLLGGSSTLPAQQDLRTLSRSLAQVASQVQPTVVQIRVTAWGARGEKSGTAFLGNQQQTGSGVILSADGYIVTNAHVVEGGRRFTIALSTPAAPDAPGRSLVAGPARELQGELVGIDRETDLAVLKVPATGLPIARLADSDSLEPGELVLALGSPLGLASSVTMGVVSAVGRQLREDDRMVYIQTDTPINPGNSGGPLVTIDGSVTGINTLILSQSGGSEGIGFAAPSNIVRHVVDQLRQFGRVRRGDIGVFAQTITPAMATALRLPQNWGVVIGDVYPGGPADKAGLKTGDVVLSVNGKVVENGRQFDVTLYRQPLGQPVTLDLRRGLQHQIIRVPVIERQDNAARLGDLVTPEKNLVPKLGVLGLEMTKDLAAQIPGLRQPRGIVVAALTPDAAAGQGGLQPGDVIYALNGTAVATVSDLRQSLSALNTGDTVVLQVLRDSKLRFVTVSVD
jgi:serine protease Do